MGKSKCPRCDHEMLGVFRRGRRLFELNPGDIVGCRNCGAILIYEGHYHREPTKEEFKLMRSDPKTWRQVVFTMVDTLKFLKRDLS